MRLSWRLTARTPHHALHHESVNLTEKSRELAITLKRANGLDVTVTRILGGTPLEHALVEAWYENDRDAPLTAGRTDLEGRVTLMRLPDGNYSIRVRHPGLAITSQPVAVPDMTEIDIPSSERLITPDFSEIVSPIVA